MSENELSTHVDEQLPAHLQETSGEGLEDAQAFIMPPRLKIVQKQSDSLLELFNVGDVVITPNNLLVNAMPYEGTKAKEDDQEPLFFVPVFWFPEWCSWNPIQLKGTAPAVIERTFDRNAPIAIKARSPKTWAEDHPTAVDDQGKPLQIRHCEHINFLWMLETGPVQDVAVCHSFVRSEWTTGSTLLSTLKMRRAAIYAQRFKATVSKRPHNPKGTWHGFDIATPNVDADESPWVSADELEKYRAIHLEYKKAHEAGSIEVDYNEESETVSSTTDEF